MMCVGSLEMVLNEAAGAIWLTVGNNDKKKGRNCHNKRQMSTNLANVMLGLFHLFSKIIFKKGDRDA